jgi:hypothetical protein
MAPTFGIAELCTECMITLVSEVWDNRRYRVVSSKEIWTSVLVGHLTQLRIQPPLHSLDHRVCAVEVADRRTEMESLGSWGEQIEVVLGSVRRTSLRLWKKLKLSKSALRRSSRNAAGMNKVSCPHQLRTNGFPSLLLTCKKSE